MAEHFTFNEQIEGSSPSGLKMSRSKFKGPFSQIFNIQNKDNKVKNKQLKIWSRKSTILPELVGLKVAIHNGKDFKECLITNDHVGHKFGEFAPTKIPAIYKRKGLPKKKR